MKTKLKFLMFGSMVLALVLNSCSTEDVSGPTGPSTVTTIELKSGGSQTGGVGKTLSNAIEVIVKDQYGHVSTNVIVGFGVAEGSVSSETEISDSSGEAKINWTLGASVGVQTLTVTAEGVSFNITASAVPFAVGDFHEGGVVFYVDETGEHGLICTVLDQSEDAIWTGSASEIAGADNELVGGGYQNTVDIISGYIPGDVVDTAARISWNLVLSGYDDWYLPSKDELNLMYQNKAAIDETALANGGDAFTANSYWTSTEYNDGFAWRQVFTGGSQYYYTKTMYEGSVRSVRTF